MKLLPSKRSGLWFVLLAEVVLLTLLTSTFGGEHVFESTFLNWSNITQVVRAVSFIAIMVVGQAVIIIAGGIDLSVGSILGLSAVVTAVLLSSGFSIPVSTLSGLLVGLACGAVNGVLVTEAKLPPFIATLGMMSVARGLAFAITGGETIRNLPAEFLTVGQGSLMGIPVPIIIMAVFAVAVGVMLKESHWGRYVYAIGGNEEAALYSGVDIRRMKLFVYSLCGLSAGISGVLFASRFGVGQSTSGLGYELDVIAAAVIGGISLSGGRGTVVGAIVGSLLMGILRNGLVLLNVSAYWQQVAIGVVIILAVIVDRKTKR
ncbi:MAG TPA: ABC transporter permease [Bacteroidota bacterium]|jgi:ribose transport system permease protein|nr:ABC transporter permease [Bacteroidota bacterium]